MEPQITTPSAPNRYRTVSTDGDELHAQSNPGKPSLTAGSTSDLPVQDTRTPEQCPSCDCETVVSTEVESYCEECGLVLRNGKIERSEPQWRDESERRLGPQQTTQWLNTGTEIGATSDISFWRVAEFNKRLTDSERSLADGLREVRNLAAGLNLPDSCRNRAAYIYRESLQQDLLKGRSIDGIAAASLYIAIREQHWPVTLADVAASSPIDESEIRHYLGVLQVELGAGLEPPSPQDFLQRVVSNLSASMDVERRAGDILDQVVESELHVGKKPIAVAATAVYAAVVQMDGELSQSDIADVIDVSAVTISRRYQDIKSVLQN